MPLVHWKLEPKAHYTKAHIRENNKRVIVELVWHIAFRLEVRVWDALDCIIAKQIDL